MGGPFANPFEAVAASLAATVDQLAGLTVEYRRPGSPAIVCQAVKARAQTDHANPAPWLGVTNRLIEWLIDPDQTPAPPVPTAGDLIVTQPGTAAARYFRVYAPAGGPVWKWGGPLNRWRRIATEEVTAPP